MYHAFALVRLIIAEKCLLHLETLKRRKYNNETFFGNGPESWKLPKLTLQKLSSVMEITIPKICKRIWKWEKKMLGRLAIGSFLSPDTWYTIT